MTNLTPMLVEPAAAWPRALNPSYPSSWWQWGFSHEVRIGEVVPLRALERDVVLWRDSDGVLHCQSAICPHLGANLGYGGSVVGDAVQCPFHGYRFDATGKVCERLQESARAPKRLALTTYVVEERFGAIFIWNGEGEPDHDLPTLADLFPDRPGLSEADVSTFHVSFYWGFPAKLFLENMADANHFGALHGACEWGDVEVIEESSHAFASRLVLSSPVDLMSVGYVREQARLGQLTNPAIAAYGFLMTTLGGGIHLVNQTSFRREGRRPNLLERLLDHGGGARVITCWAPVTSHSHVQAFTFIVPVRLPWPRGLVHRLLTHAFALRAWGADKQDATVMRYRQEPPDPVYGRLDRGLVRFRRFWDSRILDRSTWPGDDLRSNGARAGIRWGDETSSDTDERQGEGA